MSFFFTIYLLPAFVVLISTEIVRPDVDGVIWKTWITPLSLTAVIICLATVIIEKYFTTGRWWNIPHYYKQYSTALRSVIIINRTLYSSPSIVFKEYIVSSPEHLREAVRTLWICTPDLMELWCRDFSRKAINTNNTRALDSTSPWCRVYTPSARSLTSLTVHGALAVHCGSVRSVGSVAGVKKKRNDQPFRQQRIRQPNRLRYANISKYTVQWNTSLCSTTRENTWMCQSGQRWC